MDRIIFYCEGKKDRNGLVEPLTTFMYYFWLTLCVCVCVCVCVCLSLIGDCDTEALNQMLFYFFNEI